MRWISIFMMSQHYVLQKSENEKTFNVSLWCWLPIFLSIVLKPIICTIFVRFDKSCETSSPNFRDPDGLNAVSIQMFITGKMRKLLRFVKNYYMCERVHCFMCNECLLEYLWHVLCQTTLSWAQFVCICVDLGGWGKNMYPGMYTM